MNVDTENKETIKENKEKKKTIKEEVVIKNLCLAGGGSNTFCYAGCFKALNEMNCLKTIEKLAGTSAGAIWSLFLILGLTMDDFDNVIKSFNYGKLKNVDLRNVFNNWGLDTGTKFTQFLRILMKKQTGKEDMTFSELYAFKPIHFTICTVKLNTYEPVYYNVDLTPNQSVCDALRKTISLPFLIKPVKETNEIVDDYYVDGGLLDNFPIQFLPNSKETLGVIIGLNDQHNEIKYMEQYIYHLFQVIQYSSIPNKIKSYNLANIVNIKIDKPGFQMDIDLEARQTLFEIGYKAIIDRFGNNSLSTIIDRFGNH